MPLTFPSQKEPWGPHRTQGYVWVITAADKLSPSASCPTSHLNHGLGPQPPGNVAAEREPHPAFGPPQPPSLPGSLLAHGPRSCLCPSGAGLRGAARQCPTGGRGQAGLGGRESGLLVPGVCWRRYGRLSLWTLAGRWGACRGGGLELPPCPWPVGCVAWAVRPAGLRQYVSRGVSCAVRFTGTRWGGSGLRTLR